MQDQQVVQVPGTSILACMRQIFHWHAHCSKSIVLCSAFIIHERDLKPPQDLRHSSIIRQEWRLAKRRDPYGTILIISTGILRLGIRISCHVLTAAAFLFYKISCPSE